MSKEDAIQMVCDALRQFNEIHRSERPVPVGADTRLFGQGGNLDSLDLVRFVFLVEETVQEKTGKTVALTSEKAMSQRNSPFATVSSLSDHVLASTSDQA